MHLHVTSAGDYLFRLTVTDSKGQSSSANVSVVVTPEHNLPPEADAGPNVTVVYPDTEATLDGRGSSDDFRIDSWQWTQLSGPGNIVMSGNKTSVLKVKGLHIDKDLGSPTVYQFQLCVWDYHNLTDTATVTITYKKSGSHCKVCALRPSFPFSCRPSSAPQGDGWRGCQHHTSPEYRHSKRLKHLRRLWHYVIQVGAVRVQSRCRGKPHPPCPHSMLSRPCEPPPSFHSWSSTSLTWSQSWCCLTWSRVHITTPSQSAARTE